MFLTLMKSKIHRATVTEANVEYEGSVAIDPILLRAADIRPYEQVSIWNCTNGSRLETYAIEGEEGSGEICINGAAAHLNKPGDLVIIATWAQMTPEEAQGFHARRVFCDPRNRIKDDISVY
ncbi:MAG: aspartate 1-decarboxylase [Myxococcales bacterium]|nr:aspartate 1-decarboxylase [Myxococcales bacterium]